MNAAALESLIPGLAEKRAVERRNREIAFLGITRTVCGVEVVAMTPWHKIAVRLLGNAFGQTALQPLHGDVFAFLWMLSPHNGRKNRRGTLGGAVRQWRLRRHVRRLDLGKASSEVRAYIIEQSQDTPEGKTDGNAPDHAPWVAWIAQDATFWIEIHGGFTLESYLDTPLLVLQQLFRAWKCNHPDVDVDSRGNVNVTHPTFINESDRLVGRWHRAKRDAVAEIIRGQVHRI